MAEWVWEAIKITKNAHLLDVGVGLQHSGLPPGTCPNDPSFWGVHSHAAIVSIYLKAFRTSAKGTSSFLLFFSLHFYFLITMWWHSQYSCCKTQCGDRLLCFYAQQFVSSYPIGWRGIHIQVESFGNMPDSDNVNAHGSAAHVFFTEPVLKKSDILHQH